MCFQFAMLLTIEFPDEAGDRAGGKGTLVVRLGAHRCAWLHNGALALAYAALPGLAVLGLPLPAVVGVMYTAPLAALNGWRMGRRAWAQPAQWNSLALWSVALLIVGMVSQLAVFLALAGGAWR
jgi:1,4-dihydroxy-2-naphthoate octaprenyltransferase